MDESKVIESSINPFQINKSDLEEIDDFLDEKEFYFCTQRKEVSNYYATEPRDGDVWYPRTEGVLYT